MPEAETDSGNRTRVTDHPNRVTLNARIPGFEARFSPLRISSWGLTESATSFLRLLGPPTVFVNGQEVSLPTRKSLALVAYLCLEGAQTRSHLADLLWGDLDDEGARKNLRKELFRLRDTAFKAHLETDGDRVALVGVESDVAPFEGLTQSQPDLALEHYGGTLLAGLDVPGAERFQDWLEARRERLENLYRRALERRARALEDAGDLRGAIDAFETLIALDALQEVHHREVMRLRWRLGDRAGALERYARLVRLLEDELGLEPLPQTMELARRIESDEAPAESDAPALSNAPNLSPKLERPPLVGREDAWTWLESRTGGLALVVAEAGVGKTRLVTDFARSQGRALILRGFESATGTPFYPVAAALRAALEAGEFVPDDLSEVWRLEAARLVPELGLNLRQMDASPSPDGRARFLEGLSRAILAALGSDGTLVLDDLHWFDASSLELIAHLTRRGNTVQHGAPSSPKNAVQDGVPTRVGLIATARSLELAENPSAQAMLAALEREGLTARYELGPLAQPEVLSLVQALSGDRAQLFARRLFQATGGNPLFVLETLRGLFQSDLLRLEDGHWITPFDEATEDYTELPIPPNVREMALSRLERLGGVTRRWLEAASLAGEPFDAELLEGATALSDWERLEALERAIQAQVLNDAGGTYRFSHDLIRRSLSDGLGAERRRLIHRRLAANLIESQGQPAPIADHLERAGRPADAIPWRVQAAEASALIYAHAETREHYRRALALEPDARTAFAIHRALASLSVSVLDLSGLEEHAQAMRTLAKDSELEAEARLTQAKLAIYRGQFADALEQAEHARVTISGALRAEASLVAGTALVGLGKLDQAETRVRDGLESAVPSAHATTAELHAMLKVIAQQRGDYTGALEHARAAVAAYRSAHQHENELNMTAQMGQLLGAIGDSRAALELIDAAVAQTREIGFEKVLSFALFVQAEESLRIGDFAAAEGAIHEGLALSRGRILVRECQFTSLLGRLMHRTGRLAEASRVAHQAMELTERLGLAGQRALQHLVSAELEFDLERFEPCRGLLGTAEHLVNQSGQTGLRVPLESLMARLDLVEHRVAEAVERLERLTDAAHSASFEHRAVFACTLAQARLWNDDPGGAIRALEGVKRPAWLEARALAVRLEAHSRLKANRQALESDLETAARLLETASPSPLEALSLRRSMASGFTATGHDRAFGAQTDLIEALQSVVSLEREDALSPASNPGTPRERSRV